jgi:hypothetical protein
MKLKASKEFFVKSTPNIRKIYMRNENIRIERNKRRRKKGMNLVQC